MYSSTLQTGDIDGDGQSEILARWIDGLDIYRFENGTLLRHSHIPALSDNAGFYRPSWYSTIRSGVLDRKLGQADVVARESDGMHVFRYDRQKKVWREIGAQTSIRPFADKDTDGTDWTKPQHYTTIRLSDLTGDGVAELVGRGHNGLEVWRWDAEGNHWSELSEGGELSDSQGYGAEPYYSSLQLLDVDRDGGAELIARSPEGVVTYRWTGTGWSKIGGTGPFGDDDFLAGKRYKSVRASTDAAGQAWLYGLAVGSAGAGSGQIQVHRWNEGRWRFVRTLSLPGSGWNRESQFATLIAADLRGDGQPEFVVRGPHGLHTIRLDGRTLPMQLTSFTDAQGWNLTEQYGTLQTAKARIAENGDTRLRSVVLGRGAKGLEVYKFGARWSAAGESSFPQHCTNFITDSSPQCLAYKAISTAIFAGHPDIRSMYTQAGYHQADWNTYRNIVRHMANPIGVNNQAIWVVVQNEMQQELGDVSTVRGWFDNDYTVLNDSYNRSGNLLNQAVGQVDFATSKTVAAKWLSFGGDIASGIAGFLPEGGAGVSLVITIFADTYNVASGSGGNINEAITQIYTDLNNQKTDLNNTNGTVQTGYLTNYSKLQQIGQDHLTGGYDWAHATLDDISAAKNGAAHGMLLSFYRTLLPYKWYVYWCRNTIGYSPDCGSNRTPDKYDCVYVNPRYNGYTSEAYIYAGAFYSVNWPLLGQVTGPFVNGSGNLNAIWYMMLLGSDLGWDLPQYGYINSFPPQTTADPHLSYSNLVYGYNGQKSDGCNGNGSTTGIQSGNQTLSQRLNIAQQNGRRITGGEAPGLLRELQVLKEDAEVASPNQDLEVTLTSPLTEAAKLIERATPLLAPGVEGSYSATTPTHLTEQFLQSIQAHTSQLGNTQARHLAAEAYCVIAELEGQTPAGVGCHVQN